MGTSLAYVDVTDPHRLQEQLASSKRELEQAYEELQSTVEELETTNEELQSTNEELETTNEELQSTNEELETMNEELQSTNEELETMNDELRHRSMELNDMNSFLETVLTTLGMAVIAEADFVRRHTECASSAGAPAVVETVSSGAHGFWLVRYEIGGQQFVDYWTYQAGHWRFDLLRSNPSSVTLYRMPFAQYAKAVGCRP